MAQRTPKKSYLESEKELRHQLSEKNFFPVYLICGEQALLRHKNIAGIRRAIVGEGDSMNDTLLTGPEVRAADVIEIAQTLPFLAQERVVTITETEFFKRSGEEEERLCEYLKELPKTTHLIFEEISPNKAYKLYKTIAKLGCVLSCDMAAGDRIQQVDLQYLRGWVAELFAKDGIRISNPTIQLFIEYSGTDMLAIRSQYEKVAAYCMERSEVRPEDIREICTPVVRDRIFDMIRIIAEGKCKEALGIYMDLQKLQTPPQVILSLMMRQYNQLLQILEMSSNMSDEEIAKELKLNPWALSNKIKPLAAAFSAERLERLLEKCMDADYSYKNGKITAELAAECLIIQCAAGG